LKRSDLFKNVDNLGLSIRAACINNEPQTVKRNSFQIKRTFCLIACLLIFICGFAPPVGAALVNINTASSNELQALSGIGPAKAQAIIDYRSTKGLFQKIEDIMNVSGIGPATFAGIKDFITVGDTSSEQSNSSSTSSVNQAENLNTGSQSSSSAHYSATSVSALVSPSTISVGIGRDRVGSVGTPIEFRADLGAKHSIRQNQFRWNFGDGTQGSGQLVSHTYEYPGEYVVVLVATLPEGEAVSRVNATIVDPALKISAATPDRIEITSSSKYEANLFGRALLWGSAIFVFPQDTIIKAGQSISFSSKITGLKPLNIAEVSILILGERSDQSRIVAKIEEQKSLQIEQIQKEIAALEQNKIALAQNKRPSSANNAEILEFASEYEPAPNSVFIASTSERQLAAAAKAVERGVTNESGGWFQKIIKFIFKTK
jgi:competence ComEA-like helix-hairpin-helix protein